MWQAVNSEGVNILFAAENRAGSFLLVTTLVLEALERSQITGDECFLLRSRPSLELLLAGPRDFKRTVLLRVDEHDRAPPRRIGASATFSVESCPAREIGRMPTYRLSSEHLRM
jgi:hypothetical protein